MEIDVQKRECRQLIADHERSEAKLQEKLKHSQDQLRREMDELMRERESLRTSKESVAYLNVLLLQTTRERDQWKQGVEHKKKTKKFDKFRKKPPKFDECDKLKEQVPYMIHVLIST